MDNLFEYAHKLVKETNLDFFRYLYTQINWKNRFIGLVGPRGVGKTTMVLQYIKENLDIGEALYVTAEDFYFIDNRLTDLADRFVKMGGKYLFIDEIHKYKFWAKELKLIYDYHKELNVVFTGSSILDIKKGTADLSRRAVMYHLQGLSFREYLALFHKVSAPSCSLDDILQRKLLISELVHPLPYFKKYLKQGYYPFALEDDFEIRLRQVISQTLEVDIPIYAEMNVATGRKLKQLLSIIAKSAPFKPNMSKIALMLEASRNNIADYCLYIQEAGLIAQLYNNTKGLRALGKLNKIYLDNTNLIYNLAPDFADIGNVRETFFFNQLRVRHHVYASDFTDFSADNFSFEVGGKTKSRKQIRDVENAFLVKDDIEDAYLNTIPLWQFGFLY